MCYAQEINSALRRARKQHVCDWCSEPIEPKTKYFWWFGIVEGDAVNTTLHPECETASTEYSSELGVCWYANTGQPRGAINWDL